MKRNFFPASLNVKGRLCWVIGDNQEAHEKAERLHQAGARVVRKSLQQFRIKDLQKQFFVVFCPLDQPKLTQQVFKRCREKRILLCAIDQTDYCDVVNVSVFERGDLKVMISTNGVAPALAKKIRKGLETSLVDQPIETFLEKLAALRHKLERTVKDSALRREKLIAAVRDVEFRAILKLPKKNP